jgi:ribosome-binding protein aMBF1 (putative translation factor)
MSDMGTQRFSDQIRAAVDVSGMSRYCICKRIGLPESSMSRFMSGKSGLSLETLDRLAELLKLTVTTRAKGKATK